MKLFFDRTSPINRLIWLRRMTKQDAEPVDPFGEALYRLPEVTTLDGSSYIDTGIKLYDDVTKNWTVAVRYSGELRCNDGYPCNILCCMKDGTKGLLLRYYAADGAMIQMGSGGIALGQAYNNDTEINYDGTNAVVIVKNGNYYSLYCNNDSMAYGAPLGYAMSNDEAVDLTLILGARYSADGNSIQFKTRIVLEELRVYGEALSDEMATALYTSLLPPAAGG